MTMRLPKGSQWLHIVATEPCRQLIGNVENVRGLVVRTSVISYGWNPQYNHGFVCPVDSIAIRHWKYVVRLDLVQHGLCQVYASRIGQTEAVDNNVGQLFLEAIHALRCGQVLFHFLSGRPLKQLQEFIGLQRYGDGEVLRIVVFVPSPIGYELGDFLFQFS